MRYEIVAQRHLDDLADLVNEEMARGWIPQGGIAYYPGEGKNDPIFCQAMILPSGVVMGEKP